MAQTLKLLERQHLAQAERHLDTANHCVIRQLRALSKLGLHGADLSLGETVLETMLSTQELILKDKERLECDLGLRGADECNAEPKPESPKQDQEPTPLLRKRKLHTVE
jgi:hypothetical protein